MPFHMLPCGSRHAIVLSCAALVLAFTGCDRAASTDTRKNDEEAIRSLDVQWSKTAGAHDLDGTVAFYADNAVLLPPDEPAANDKAAIRASWAGALSAFETLSWEVTRIEVAKSGDIAYLTGKWKGNAKVPSGPAVETTGKLLEVWGKQADGKWKCIADTYNNDAPAASNTPQSGKN